MENRIEYVDISKAILIVFVVIGHVIQLNEQDGNHVLMPFLQLIQTFHMPAFFIINGMLFDESKWPLNKWKDYLIKKCQTLIVPFAFFEILGAVFIVLIFHEANIKGAIFNSISQYYNVGADWFLISLFFADIIMYFISRVNNKTGHIIMLICLILPQYMVFNHYIVFAGRCVLALGFVLIGYYAKDFFFKVEEKYSIVSFSILLIVSITNGFTAFVSCSINNFALYAIGGVSGTIFILSISQIIHSKVMEEIGKNTLPIMGTHQNVIKLICRKVKPNSISSVLIIMCVVAVFEWLFIFTSNRFWPVLIGKKFER